MRARLEPSQTECWPVRRGTDLTDVRKIEGSWIDSAYRYAHPSLQKSQLRDLINLDLLTRIKSDNDVQPAGQCENLECALAMKRAEKAILMLDHFAQPGQLS